MAVPQRFALNGPNPREPLCLALEPLTLACARPPRLHDWCMRFVPLFVCLLGVLLRVYRAARGALHSVPVPQY